MMQTENNMKVELAYYEITEYLRLHNNQELVLTYVSPSTVNVQTHVKVTFVKTHFDANITLEKIVGNDLYLSYSISPALNWVVKHALPILRIKNRMIDVDEGNLVFHLDKISQLQKVLQTIELQSVAFSQDNVNLCINLK